MSRGRKVVLMEVDEVAARATGAGLEAELLRRWPGLRPVVFGAMSGAEVDAAFRKLRQLSRETEDGASMENRVHSAHKALSFFRDAFPLRFWSWFAIGEDQSRRQRLLR